MMLTGAVILNVAKPFNYFASTAFFKANVPKLSLLPSPYNLFIPSRSYIKASFPTAKSFRCGIWAGVAQCGLIPLYPLVCMLTTCLQPWTTSIWPSKRKTMST